MWAFLLVRERSKDRSLRQLLQGVRHLNVGAAAGCDLLILTSKQSITFGQLILHRDLAQPAWLARPAQGRLLLQAFHQVVDKYP